MSLEQRITAFSTLGRFLSQFSSETPQKIDDLPKNNLFFDGMSEALLRAQQQNAWFTLPHL